MKVDHRSYRRNFCSCEKKTWKKKFTLVQDSNPWPLQCRCSTVTDWANKPTGSRSLNWFIINPWKDDDEAMNIWKSYICDYSSNLALLNTMLCFKVEMAFKELTQTNSCFVKKNLDYSTKRATRMNEWNNFVDDRTADISSWNYTICMFNNSKLGR